MANSSEVERRHVKLRRATLLLAAAAVPLGWLAATTGPAQAAAPRAAASTQTITVADVAEAWYATSPVDICTTPLGCPPSQVPTSPYPADTLHVGAAGGQESARTYLQPDLAALPFDATLVAGEMTLPVANGTGDGTVTPDAAKIRACLATQAVQEGVQGSTSAPPKVDCGVSTTLTYDSATSTFSLDLQPFVDAWSHGAPQLGIALVPDSKSAQPTDAWHVAFNGHKRAGSGHISSTLTVRINASPDTTTAVPPAPVVPAVPAPPAPTLPVPAAVAPAAPAPVVAPSQQPQTLPAQQVALVQKFQYPLAFLLPLALLAGAVFFARLFTRDLTPRRVSA